MKKFFVIVMLALAASVTFPASAFNFGFLKNTPAAKFSDQDWRILRETTKKGLNKKADGATLSWRNPDTRNSGTVTILKTFKRHGRTCRSVRFVSKAAMKTGDETVNLCRTDDDTWKLFNPG